MRTPKQVIEFPNDGTTFGGYYAALEWCHQHNLSVGSMCYPQPTTLMRGAVNIAKWKNLSDEEKAACDGTLTSDVGGFRSGTVKLSLFIEPLPRSLFASFDPKEAKV